MAATTQAVLAQRLSALLGFEDGANDVLEHLVSIESSEDLTDYLSQLLGRNDEEVQKFVKDVGRVQRGEALSVPVVDVEDDVKPAAVPTERTYEAKQKPKVAPPPKKESPHTIFGKPVAAKAASMPPAAAKAPASAAAKLDASVTEEAKTKSKTPPPPVASNPAPTPPAAAPTRPPPPKSRPPKGKASVVCGCYGSLHKPLTNCLYCGRISCEREGYDFCPFCGMLVEQVTGGEGTKAWEHKERLLRFDRDFARRTVVLDDQADFFTTNKSWLTEEERIAVEEKQAEHKEKLRTREKQTLDIGFF